VVGKVVNEMVHTRTHTPYTHILMQTLTLTHACNTLHVKLPVVEVGIVRVSVLRTVGLCKVENKVNQMIRMCW
jgi:hypothetical protein